MTDPGHEPSDYQRGREDGRIDEKLAGLERNVLRINGSVADTGVALRSLESTVRTQGEDARLREERVVAAAEALAAETERRRSELADTVATTDRAWTRRERWIGVCLAVVTVAGSGLAVAKFFG